VSRYVDIPVRLDFHVGDHGAPTYDSTLVSIDRGVFNQVPGVTFATQAYPKLDRYGEVPATGWITLSTPTRRIDALREVLRSRTYYVAESGSDVEMRVLGPADVAYTYAAGVWSAAVGDTGWLAPSVVDAAINDWTLTTIGAQFRFRSTSGTAVPIIYGMDLHCRIEMARASTSERIGSTFVEDAIVRTLLYEATQNLYQWDVDEFPAQDTGTGACAYVDYSAGVGRLQINVTTVEAVYDLDADPTRATPLPGAWNGTTKRYTFTTPVALGTTLSVRYKAAPPVVLQGDADHYTETLPELAITSFDVSRRMEWTGRYVIVDEDAEVVYAIAAPTEQDLALDVSALAETVADAMDTAQALLDYIGKGRRLVSASTGFGFDVYVASPMRSGTRGTFAEVTVGLRIVGVLDWNGTSVEHQAAVEFEVDRDTVATQV